MPLRLTAVPLFILTGDVLVCTGLSRKFLDVADALTCWSKGGFGSATVLVCGMFSAISGSDAAGSGGRRPHDYRPGLPNPAIRVPMPAPWSPRGACTGILIPPSIAYIIIGLVLGIFRIDPVSGGADPRSGDPGVDPDHQYRDESDPRYKSGGNIPFRDWLGNVGRSIRSGWYAFLVPGIVFYGIFPAT